MKSWKQPKRILIFRPGSLGDTIVALPCFHLLARVFPDAERRVLKNVRWKSVQVGVEAALRGSGLVHGYFEVDHRRMFAHPRELWALMKRIRAWKPDLLVHLTEPRGVKRVVIEWAFFKLCGVGRIMGMPISRELRNYKWDPERNSYEYEAARLGRCLAKIGEIHLEDRANWDLLLSEDERLEARTALGPARSGEGLIVCGVGTAVDTKDWGSDNWLALTKTLTDRARGHGLAMVGATEDFERAELVRREWAGPSVNLCGKLTVRLSSAVMGLASLYVGHDSGPMHLAAAAGVPCVSIFSARIRAGIWFPYGARHQILYHDVPCSDCDLDVCPQYQKRCITSITVAEVSQAADEYLMKSDSLAGPIGTNGSTRSG
jgi:heptosyltransferase III